MVSEPSTRLGAAWLWRNRIYQLVKFISSLRLLDYNKFVHLFQTMEELIPAFFNKRICQLTWEDNFQSCKQQVLLAVHGFNLEGYLFGTLHVPHMIGDGDGNTIINPEYAKFSQWDSSLASWLPVSISSLISKGLVVCITYASIWTKLHQHYQLPV